MRKIYEILRLTWLCGLPGRKAARACQVSCSTVQQYLSRAEKAGLSGWEQVRALDEVELERKLFPPPPGLPTSRPLPDWNQIHRELQKKGVTRQLLWEEYRARYPEDGLAYSRFCERYQAYRRHLDLSLRQVHRAGEKLFVDYCGQTVPVIDPETGESQDAQIFVAVLGASSYTFAEATWTQQLPDWTGSHERAFEAFGGTTQIVVPDNLRSGVSRACRYEPELNPTYRDLAEHYGVAVIPARVRRPKDKAKAEAGVLLVERWILACLRHRQFFSLDELNEAIAELLVKLNDRPFRKLPGSRRSRFEELDRPALRPLPATRYEFAEWSKARVGPDYHVELDGHYYSVPYQLVGKLLDLRRCGAVVECFHRSRRVAAHRYSQQVGEATALREHMPRAHREYLDWTPQRLVRWARQSGPHISEAVERILSSRPHPYQGFHAALGLRSLAKSYGQDRLEAACRRALRLGAVSYTSLKSMLQRGLESQPLPEAPEPIPPLAHDNVRGATYYRQAEQEVAPC